MMLNDEDLNKIIKNLDLECSLSDCNRIQTHNHLACKRTLSHFAKLVKKA